MGQGYASVDTLQPGRAAMVSRVKPGTRAHSERHSKVPEEGWGGYRRGPGGWGVNGRGAASSTCPSPLQSCKVSFAGRMPPDPSSDGCSGLSQPYTARKRLLIYQ